MAPKGHPRSPTDVDRAIGDKVRQRRVLLGMSQEKLAEKLTITFQQVQKYERGSNRISASRLVEIAEALDAPVTWFLEASDDDAKMAALSKRALTIAGMVDRMDEDQQQSVLSVCQAIGGKAAA